MDANYIQQVYVITNHDVQLLGMLVAVLASFLLVAGVRAPAILDEYEEYGDYEDARGRSALETELDVAMKHCLSQMSDDLDPAEDNRNGTKDEKTSSNDTAPARMDIGHYCGSSSARGQNLPLRPGSTSSPRRQPNRTLKTKVERDHERHGIYAGESSRSLNERTRGSRVRRFDSVWSTADREADKPIASASYGAHDQGETLNPRRTSSDSPESIECLVHCVFAKAQLMTPLGMPSEALLLKRLEDSLEEPLRRVTAIRAARSCFDRLGSIYPTEDDPCLYSKRLAECLNMDILREVRAVKGSKPNIS